MADYANDFPFDILWVAEKCGLLEGNVKYRGAEISVRCPLPGCGDTSEHLGLNLKKNAWKCLKCGEKGGMVSLYAKLGQSQELDISTATRELYRLWEDEHGTNPDNVRRRDEERKRRLAKLEKQAPKEVVAPIERRDAAYRALLNYLPLNDEHMANLTERGLTPKDIERFHFKSLTAQRNTAILVPRSLDTEDVAGFYTRNGKRCVNTDSEGILIPYLDLYGRIAMMEIRRFGKGPRYQRFASGKPTLRNRRTGCTKSVTAVHHIGIDPENPPEKVYLTEGALKSYVSHALTGRPYIAIPGVNNPKGLKEALEELKQIGVETIVLAFDMDFYSNTNVEKGLKNAKAMIRAAGLQLRFLTWDPKYKGIDDLHWAKRKAEIEKKEEEGPEEGQERSISCNTAKTSLRTSCAAATTRWTTWSTSL